MVSDLAAAACLWASERFLVRVSFLLLADSTSDLATAALWLAVESWLWMASF
jgi:hypothetical protein